MKKRYIKKIKNPHKSARISALISGIIKQQVEDVKQKPYKLIIFLAGYSILSWLWGFEAAFFLGTFLLFLFYQWENRIFIALGLLFLAVCPFYLIQRKLASAEQAAVYAYYFLALGVILQIVEYIRDSRIKEFKD